MEDLSLKKGQTFKEFNQRFYERFPDLSVFDCGDDLNLVKVVLDGLKVNYSERLKSRPFIQFPVFIIILRFYLKRIQNLLKPRLIYNQKSVLVFGTPRRVLNSSSSLVYFQKILDFYGSNALYISTRSEKEKGICEEDLFNVNLPLISDIKLLFQLKLKLNALRNSFSYQDYLNIQIALSGFYEKYLFWSAFLKNNDFKVAYFEQHYHREGFIYALKKSMVHAVEVQHGLISCNDIFYCFPSNIQEVKINALFPDQIFLIGEHWKNVLMEGNEFSEDSLALVSDFWEYPLISDNLQTITEVTILISSQTLMRDFLWSYAIDLATKTMNANVQVIYKPHPSESNMSIYESNGLPDLDVRMEDIYRLFEISDIQISVYSTTLIEGLRFGVKAYSLNKKDCKEYVDEFVKYGISSLLEIDEVPPLKKKSNDNMISSEYYFKPFTKDLFEQNLYKIL